MAHNPHHEHLMNEVAEMFKPLFKKSPRAIYLYLDDEHKICNEKFSQMLGYKNPREWETYKYPVSDVADEDKEKAITTYMNVSNKLVPSTLRGSWVRKDGKKIKTEVTMVPITYSDEVFVLHFITPEK